MNLGKFNFHSEIPINSSSLKCALLTAVLCEVDMPKAIEFRKGKILPPPEVQCLGCKKYEEHSNAQTKCQPQVMGHEIHSAMCWVHRGQGVRTVLQLSVTVCGLFF